MIQTNLYIIVVASVSERVNSCNNTGVIGDYCTNAPGVVGVACNRLCVLINDGDYVTLNILDEVVGNRVVKNTAYGILVIVKRDKRIAVPSLTENFGTVERIGVENTVNRLARSDAVCIVGVDIVVKGLKLTSLFPSQSMTEVLNRVAIIVYVTKSIKNSLNDYAPLSSIA